MISSFGVPMLMKPYSSAPQLLIGLLAYWKMNSNGTDATGNGHTLTINSASFTTGKIGNGVTGFGSGDAVITGSPGALNVTGDLGISLWLYITAGNNYQCLVLQGEAGGTAANLNYAVMWHATGLGLATKNNSFSNCGLTVNQNTWYNLIVNRYSDGTFEMMLNGVSGSTGTLNGPNDQPSHPVRIGSREDDYSRFPGIIDEVAIYDRALTGYTSSGNAVTAGSDAALLYNGGNGRTHPF